MLGTTRICLCMLLGLVAAVSGRDSGPIIGIDIGTTYSSVAVQRVPDGPIEIIPDERGHKKMPSWVSFSKRALVVGERAKDAFPDNLDTTVMYPKHLIGRIMSNDLAAELDRWPFPLFEQDPVTPYGVCTAILTKLKANAEAYLGEPVTRAVIAVPPYFNLVERVATEAAANIAGLHVLSLLNESSAAIIAYDLDKNPSEAHTLVYDFGGGAFTATVNRFENGKHRIVDMQTDRRYGSERIDEILVKYFADSYEKQSGKNLTDDPRAMAKLLLEAEKAKILLDDNVSARVWIEDLHQGNSFSETVTRSKFDELTGDLIWRTVFLSETALLAANFSREAEQLLDVQLVLAGSSSRIPRAQRLLTDYFHQRHLLQSIDPSEVVAYGAAKHAATFHDSPEDSFSMSSSPWRLGLSVAEGQVVEVVALQAPLNIAYSYNVTTTEDNQTILPIKIFRAGHLSSGTALFAEFAVSDIAPAPKGTPQIEVVFKFHDVWSLYVVALDISRTTLPPDDEGMVTSERSVSIELDMREEGPWLFVAEEPPTLEQEPLESSASVASTEDAAQWDEAERAARDSLEKVTEEKAVMDQDGQGVHDEL